MFNITPEKDIFKKTSIKKRQHECIHMFYTILDMTVSKPTNFYLNAPQPFPKPLSIIDDLKVALLNSRIIFNIILHLNQM